MDVYSEQATRLIAFLSDGCFHTSEQIAEVISVSPQDCTKLIAALSTRDLKVEYDLSRGYRLPAPLNLLNAEQITQYLQNGGLTNFRLDIFNFIDSTNDFLRRYPQPLAQPHYCLSESQQAGKGRMKRQWFSPFAQNIYCSMALDLQKELSQLSGMSLVVSLGIARVLEQMPLPEPIKIKWPNDIMIGDKKICGNLIEVFTRQNHSIRAIIGVGLNVNMRVADAVAINQPWTSLRLLTDQPHERNRLAASLILSITEIIKEFDTKGLQPFMARWHEHDYLLGNTVVVHHLHETHHGVVLGISPEGNLLLRLASGHIQSFSSGDTTFR